MFRFSNYDVVHVASLVTNKGISTLRVSELYGIPEQKILYVMCAWKNFPLTIPVGISYMAGSADDPQTKPNYTWLNMRNPLQ